MGEIKYKIGDLVKHKVIPGNFIIIKEYTTLHDEFKIRGEDGNSFDVIIEEIELKTKEE